MSHLFPALRTMLEELIAAPSVSSLVPEIDQGNLGVVERLAGWLEAAGFRTQVLPLPGRLDKANLVATLGGGPGGLVLSGHTDTVPCDPERWHHDPYRLTEEGGRLYGLGTADMKSFLALAIEAARGLEAGDLKQPLIVLATADEESSMKGARALAAAGRPLGRYAVIGEPTSLRPVRMHKGVMWESVRLIGRTGHASDPRLGLNALDGMQEVMSEIIAWRAELRDRFRHPSFPLPHPTVNLGHIHGGDNPNRICGECELQIDLRVLPGLDMDELRGELARRVAAVADRRGLMWELESLFAGIPPAETPAKSLIVRAGEALTGHAAEAASYGTEAPFFNEMGMETLVLGPGNIEQAHQPDEYLEVSRIDPTLDLLRALIRRFCLEG